jgi:Mor family transcriptional regulator
MSGILDEMQRVVEDVTGDAEQSRVIVHALVKNFAGEQFRMPARDLSARNMEIKRLHHAQVEISVLAKRYKLDRTTIWRIVNS